MTRARTAALEQDLATSADSDRFEFGENWARFLSGLTEDRIAQSEKSIRDVLGVDQLAGRSFLDVGSGSGLSSLAAMRLGAERVHSFDFDVASVACTRELKRRFFPYADNWSIERGDALDPSYTERLGTFNVVYAWGVLHHTGDMWKALDNVGRMVSPTGRLWISIYNDQGLRSRGWRGVKRTYNRLPAWARLPFVIVVSIPMELRSFVGSLVVGRPRRYVDSWTGSRERGMSRWHDLVDWVGGYPFEVSKPEQVFEFFKERGFALEQLFTVGGGLGCNQFVFSRESSLAAGEINQP
jgi:2-polyprenyl-6-hydroxyphenyl methylase/3-demethylubiquinone-9 3-methyltransferase